MRLSDIGLIALLFLCSCGQIPSEVRLSQLTPVRYYRKEFKGEVLHKTHFYYKPYIYMYGRAAYTGKVKDFTSKEELKAEGSMKDGFPHGPWIYYNSNGSIKARGNYNNGIKDSIWISTYTDGTRKVEEKYSFRNDTLLKDTISAWFYNGKTLIDTKGDTVRRYSKTGRVRSKTIKGEAFLHEDYLEDGTVYYRKSSQVKESFYTNGKLRFRTYYLLDKKGAEMFAADKHRWSEEEKLALKKADSVSFDYSNYWDPVIKIYVRE